jgi:large subunit ribosomal protein L22
MPKWGYSTVPFEPERTAKASGRELRISHKSAREVCKTIKGMKLDQAKSLLQQVVAKKRPIPYTRHKKKVGHRHGLQKGFAGKYPTKAAEKILRVLENAEANAEYKGLDTEKLHVTHASAYPGTKLKRYTERAFGQASPRFKTLCHVELILEQEEKVGET